MLEYAILWRKVKYGEEIEMGGVIVAVLSFVCSVNIFVCKSCSES